MPSIYEQDLDKTPANFAALSPVSFLERSADIYPDLTAVIHGQRCYSWAQVRERSARLANALLAAGVQRGHTVSVMLSNTPEMLEAHYAVPAVNAVLHALNTRLDAALIAWQMNHCEASVLITDREFSATMKEVLDILHNQYQRHVLVIDVDDSEYSGSGERIGDKEYEAWLKQHPPVAQLAGQHGGVPDVGSAEDRGTPRDHHARRPDDPGHWRPVASARRRLRRCSGGCRLRRDG